MADGSAASLKSRVSEAEWQARVELAALYRLVALHGWDDMIFTHVSARVPGPEHHFLINPYGLLFEEMTASSLVKIDTEGRMVLSEALKAHAGIGDAVTFVGHGHKFQIWEPERFKAHLEEARAKLRDVRRTLGARPA